MAQPTYPAKKRYDDANTVKVTVKLNKKTDADIIDYLDKSGNKQGTIKTAIRAQIEREQG